MLSILMIIEAQRHAILVKIRPHMERLAPLARCPRTVDYASLDAALRPMLTRLSVANSARQSGAVMGPRASLGFHID